MNSLKEALKPVHHGFGMAVLALILGALWAAYMGTHHEQLHSAFEAQEEKGQQAQMNHLMKDMSMDSMQMEDAANHNHSSAMPDGHQDGHDAASHATGDQHSHSGSLAKDAMQRLLRGHIHFMGIGILSIVMLILVASTSLEVLWKKTFGWTFGLGSLLYPPAWILMGFRTVELGPQAAEASVLWLFGPAVGLLIGSLVALFAVMAVECIGLKNSAVFAWAFEK